MMTELQAYILSPTPPNFALNKINMRMMMMMMAFLKYPEDAMAGTNNRLNKRAAQKMNSQNCLKGRKKAEDLLLKRSYLKIEPKKVH
jgi:hypothetical protein